MLSKLAIVHLHNAYECHISVVGGGGSGTGPQTCLEGQVLPFSFDQVSPGVLRILPVVCVGGVLRSICSRGFDDRDAAVVCRTLGAFIGLSNNTGKCVF